MTITDSIIAELEDIRATIAVVMRCGRWPEDGKHLDTLREQEADAVRRLRETHAVALSGGAAEVTVGSGLDGYDACE